MRLCQSCEERQVWGVCDKCGRALCALCLGGGEDKEGNLLCESCWEPEEGERYASLCKGRKSRV